MNAATDNGDLVLVAPERIVAETCAEFRSAALDRLGSPSAAGCRALTIQMAPATELDASGLGVLVLIQKRAKERGMSTRLVDAPERVHNLLKLTKLDFLFERGS